MSIETKLLLQYQRLLELERTSITKEYQGRVTDALCQFQPLFAAYDYLINPNEIILAVKRFRQTKGNIVFHAVNMARLEQVEITFYKPFNKGRRGLLTKAQFIFRRLNEDGSLNLDRPCFQRLYYDSTDLFNLLYLRYHCGQQDRINDIADYALETQAIMPAENIHDSTFRDRLRLFINEVLFWHAPFSTMIDITQGGRGVLSNTKEYDGKRFLAIYLTELGEIDIELTGGEDCLERIKVTTKTENQAQHRYCNIRQLPETIANCLEFYQIHHNKL